MGPQAERDWAACAPWLDAALSYDPLGAYRLDDVKKEIEAEEAHFWRWPMDHALPPTACAVTNFVIYPRLKVLSYWLLGGDMASIRAMLPLVEDWGLLQGCTVFAGTGRPGFARAFAADGYQAAATFYLKKLSLGPLQ